MRIMSLALLFSFAIATNAAPISSEEQFYREAQLRCGDDLQCYFSPLELKQALGYVPKHAAAHIEDLYREEDGTFSEEAAELFQPELKRSVESAPIWPSFIKNMRACAPGCVPKNYSTYGVRARPSCHNQGKAADVGSIVCNKVEYKAIREGRYKTFVGCMKGKMTVLYENGRGVTEGHHDHAHYSNGCILPGGRKYY